ncbi:6-hydroxymethylpterin diphosphokinase MptE-like protein [Gottfriedia acidiceleris]|uniref:6-hydroxymethylpterin diphosphokinase MptE-like protein n=1 Tax=Gottfriedia acidiceleris TaxID=371036 RepID=UPI003000E7F1
MIREMIKSNKVIINMIKPVRMFQLLFFHSINQLFFNINKWFRVTNFVNNSLYLKLKQFKNIHKGERCFIVATGPSLLNSDLEKLKNEITFSMNSIFLAFEETDWRPTYYGIQFTDLFKKYKNKIDHLDVRYKFIANVISKQFDVSDDYYIYPLDLLNHNMKHKRFHTKFSDDAYAVIYDGYTITYSLIQLAVYMGFNEIYLIGVDCNYSKDKINHFKDYNLVDSNYTSTSEKMISAYNIAKEYADCHNIKIFNATRGGMLEVFERVDLDVVLEKDNNTIRTARHN